MYSTTSQPQFDSLRPNRDIKSGSLKCIAEGPGSYRVNSIRLALYGAD